MADKDEDSAPQVPTWDNSESIPPTAASTSKDASDSARVSTEDLEISASIEVKPGILVDMLDQDERYPILIAGSAQSGKSTVIISLIHAAARSGREGDVSVDVSFGYSLFAGVKREDEAKVNATLRYAERFFQKSANDFILAREHLDATQEDIPVVLPLDFTIRGQDEPIKIAIIDGRGEWYEPNQNPNEALGETTYKDFPDDIRNLIQMYEPAMSFVWVAPTNAKDVHLGDFGLIAALSQYQRHRPAASRALDSHIYLLSKWDAESSFHTGDSFERLDGQRIVDYVDKNYRGSWDKFRGLPLGRDDAERRKFMQYCSWRFQNGRPVILTAGQLDAFLRYPRTLLNWLIANAVKVEARRDGKTQATLSLALFPDVMPADTTFVPLSYRIIRALTA